MAQIFGMLGAAAARGGADGKRRRLRSKQAPPALLPLQWHPADAAEDEFALPRMCCSCARAVGWQVCPAPLIVAFTARAAE